MRDLAALVLHRDLADEPVPRHTLLVDGLLFYELDVAGGEGAFEFACEFLFRITGQHVEHVTAKNPVARNSLDSELAVSVPRYDPVVAVDDVDRYGQRVEDGLGEPPVLLAGLRDGDRGQICPLVPRAAFSHSASVGSRRPAQRQ